MDIRAALKGQYHGALAMLKEAIERCPEELWEAGDGGGRKKVVGFWRVAYHTLFFTDLYLREKLEAFRPWKKHREGAQKMTVEVAGAAYTKKQVLEYWGVVDRMVDKALDGMDLDRKECGFFWYRMSKVEHQIVSIRHIQHHTAILAGRLRRAKGMNVGWVGKA